MTSLSYMESPWKEDFPFLSNSEGIYMDSAATSQRPQYVQEGISSYIMKGSSNIGRSSYCWASKWKNLYEDTRKEVKEFLGVSEGELIFTSGCTDSCNLLCSSLKFNSHGMVKNIIYTPGDHESFIQPWLKFCSENPTLELIPLERNGYGEYDLEGLENVANENTFAVLVTHTHNVSGKIESLINLRKAIHPSTYMIVDGAQSISHVDIDLASTQVDAFMFSGHKMFASFGIGGLWVSERVYSNLTSSKIGGGSKNGPQSFEPGTPNLEGVLSLKLAIDYIKQTRRDGAHKYLDYLTQYLYQSLFKLKAVQLRYDIRPYSLNKMAPLASFSFINIKSEEAGDYLSEAGLFLRTGTMCTGIMSASNDALIRVSLHIYNSKNEIDELMLALEQLGEYL